MEYPGDGPARPLPISEEETAPVRPGEELDLAALRLHLNKGIESVSQFPGGHSNLTYLITLEGGRELVLRRAPLGPVPPKAHDMVREARVLAAVSPHFAPAPRPELVCEDPSVLGSPFFLMERRQGIILRSQVPPEIAAQPNHEQRIGTAFVDCLAALHSIDIEKHGLRPLGKPEGFVERQVRGWADRWNLARTDDSPVEMDSVIHWLANHIPKSHQATLVHNDYKLDNTMLAADSIDRVEAVLDWEMATVGDPMIDVGLTLCYWVHASFSSFTTGPGWHTRDSFLQAYASRAGAEIHDIRFHETLGIFKLAVILQQIYFRYRKGQTRDERFAVFGQRVAALTGRALGLFR